MTIAHTGGLSKNVPFTVIGTLKAKGESSWGRSQDDIIFIPISTARMRVSGRSARSVPDDVGNIYLTVNLDRNIQIAEEELAEFTGYPRAILFSTGYMANLGLCQALISKGDYVFEDRLNHASLIDGGLITGARLQRYAHNDAANAELKIKNIKNTDAEKLLLSDGVFSMDGDIADIPALARCCHRTNSWLMVDDAHGFGTVGETGKGCLQHFGLTASEVPVYMATLGKAMGTAGAFIAGSDELIETIIQTARTYIYTTAMPAAIAEATRCSLQIVQNEPRYLNNLNNNISYFRKCCTDLSLPIEKSQTAIQPVIVGDDYTALQISDELFERGFLVTAIRPPTVPEGTSRLRITLSAKHTREHIDQLIETLSPLLKNNL